MSSFDENLLFGVFALQNGLITREELIAGIRVWLQDRARPLNQVLIELGHLTIEDCEILTPLVERHLAQHDDDSVSSLAAIEAVSSLRTDLRDMGVQSDQVDATTVAWQPRTEHGRYQRLRLHAKGGFGEVYVARDQDLDRDVALKQVQKRYEDDTNLRARFFVEAKITGALEHPGIIPVYGLGADSDGRPYYAMRFVRGQSLKEAIDEYFGSAERNRTRSDTTLQFRMLLRRFVDVCNAIEYAHSRGIVHRDLKPGNVMLGKYGETLVVDWGLAKALGHAEFGVNEEPQIESGSGSGVTPTRHGAAIGTPAFMSPEQAAGKQDEVGPSTDVYGLGATLYYLLSGQAPFTNSNGELLSKVQRGQFVSPRKRVSSIPKPLEAICLKAMSLQPSNRYASAASVAKEIECWLADEPVSAYRERIDQRVARWARRHRSWTRAVAAAATLVTAVAVLSAYIVGEVAEERRRLLYNSDIGAAHLAWRDGHVGRVLELLRFHEHDDDLHSFDWHYLWKLCNRSQTALEKPFDWRPRRTALIPGTEPPNPKIVLGCGDGFVRVVELRSFRETGEFRGPGSSYSLKTLESGGPGWERIPVAYSTATHLMAYADKDQTRVILQEWPNGKERTLTGNTAPLYDMAFTSEGNKLAVACGDGVRLYDVSAGSTGEWQSLSGIASAYRSVAISPNGLQVAAGNEDGLVTTWSIDGSGRRDLGSHAEGVVALAFSPDGERLASGGRDAIVNVWNLQSGTSDQLNGHRDEVRSVAFSPDGNMLATGSRDNTAILWDAQGRPIEFLKGHSHNVESVEFWNDGNSLKLITASSDRTIKIWDLPKTAPNVLIVGAPIEDVLILPDGRTIVSRERQSGIIRRSDLITGVSNTFSRGYSFASTEKVVAVGKEGSVELWRVAQWEEKPVVIATSMSGRITALAFSKVGQLAAGYDDGSILVFDSWGSQNAPHPMKEKHSYAVTSLSFSSDGKILASAAWDGVCLLHQTNDGAGRQLGETANDGIMSVRFSPSGSLLAFGGFDNKVQIWRCADNIPAFAKVGELLGHSDGVFALVFSPDERTIITACDNNTLRVWDIRERQERISLVEHTSAVEGLAMAESGDLLISGSRDGTIRIWRAATREQVRSSEWWRKHLGREGDDR